MYNPCFVLAYKYSLVCYLIFFTSPSDYPNPSSLIVPLLKPLASGRRTSVNFDPFRYCYLSVSLVFFRVCRQEKQRYRQGVTCTNRPSVDPGGQPGKDATLSPSSDTVKPITEEGPSAEQTTLRHIRTFFSRGFWGDLLQNFPPWLDLMDVCLW